MPPRSANSFTANIVGSRYLAASAGSWARFIMMTASRRATSPSIPSLTAARNALSNSPASLTAIACSCRLSAAAGASLALRTGLYTGLVGLIRTPTLDKRGTTALRNSSCLPIVSSVIRVARHVAAGPAEAGHQSDPDRVPGRAKDDGDCRGGALCRQCRRGAPQVKDQVYFELNQLGR